MLITSNLVIEIKNWISVEYKWLTVTENANYFTLLKILTNFFIQFSPNSQKLLQLFSQFSSQFFINLVHSSWIHLLSSSQRSCFIEFMAKHCWIWTVATLRLQWHFDFSSSSSTSELNNHLYSPSYASQTFCFGNWRFETYKNASCITTR